MDAALLRSAMREVSVTMTKNRDYLVELDQTNGDGDLGISMDDGYQAAANFLEKESTADLGRLLMGAAGAFNEAAPSSLGTITSIGITGMAHTLKGKEEATLADLVAAFQNGVDRIMQRTGSKPGEKTIIDSLCPAIEALAAHVSEGAQAAFKAAAQAAKEGSEKTRSMMPVHGRAAYYGEKSIGVLDGGSVVGQLLFEALYRCAQQNGL